MNRKMIALVMVVIIGVLVVSAFSWTPDHIGLNTGREADAARYTAMAESFAAKEAANIQRGRDADAARYTAMAKPFTTLQDSVQLGREADAARYTAMAEFFAAKEAASIQRGRAADAARYTAMAKLYAAQSESIQYGPPGR